MISRVFLTKIIRSVLLFSGLLFLPVRAENPVPLATFDGEVRTFSPDGRFVVFCKGQIFSVANTSDWKILAEKEVPLDGRPSGVLVDNNACVGIICSKSESISNLTLIQYGSGHASIMGADAKIDHPTLCFDDKGFLSIRGISNYFDHTYMLVGSEFKAYPTTMFSCSVATFLSLAEKMDLRLTPATAAYLRQNKLTIKGPPGSTNQSADIYTEQTDFFTTWEEHYTANPSHPAYGWKPDENFTAKDKINMKGAEQYEFKNNKVSKMMGDGFDLIYDESSWKVKVAELDQPFDLVQLGIPDIHPWRISPDGQMVAFYNGSQSFIFGAEVVKNPYANLSPEVTKDLLIAKLMNALKAEHYADSLPIFDSLEKLGQPLPEAFYFNRATAYEKSGKKVEARKSAETYVTKYGSSGKYYADVIDILSRL